MLQTFIFCLFVLPVDCVALVMKWDFYQRTRKFEIHFANWTNSHFCIKTFYISVCLFVLRTLFVCIFLLRVILLQDPIFCKQPTPWEASFLTYNNLGNTLWMPFPVTSDCTVSFGQICEKWWLLKGNTSLKVCWLDKGKKKAEMAPFA